MIAEEVAVLTGFGDAEDHERKRREFLAWLIDKRDEWGQEALGFEFEGDLWYLIPARPGAPRRTPRRRPAGPRG